MLVHRWKEAMVELLDQLELLDPRSNEALNETLEAQACEIVCPRGLWETAIANEWERENSNFYSHFVLSMRVGIHCRPAKRSSSTLLRCISGESCLVMPEHLCASAGSSPKVRASDAAFQH